MLHLFYNKNYRQSLAWRSLVTRGYTGQRMLNRNRPLNQMQNQTRPSTIQLLLTAGSLDLPERPELPERPPKYRKDQRIIGVISCIDLTSLICIGIFVFNYYKAIYSTGIAMLLSNVFCRDATRSAKKINPHANPALNPRNSRAKPSLFPR